MTLAEARAAFLARLNRSDCDAALADSFLGEGMRRVQRELRAPFMERVHWVDAKTQPIESIEIPADYIEAVEVLCGGQPLTREPFRSLMRVPAAGCPGLWGRYRSTLYFRGAIPTGKRVELLYYGNFSALPSDSSANELTTSAPDLLIYGSLSVAGDHFEHDKRAEWEARYTSILAQVSDQAERDEITGGPMAIQPAYY